MAKPDDLEAVRTIASALNGFSPEEQERILRWVREKIGLAPAARALPDARIPQLSMPGAPVAQLEPPAVPPAPASGKDLKTFINSKQPKSDVQFAAAVAYYHRFDAPPEQRRNEIDANILQDACRLAGRARFQHPLMTLNNAKNLGLLDSGTEKGKFTINTVGENLVAMTLPGKADASSQKKAKHTKKPASQAVKKKN
jgi:hypothetical protein